MSATLGLAALAAVPEVIKLGKGIAQKRAGKKIKVGKKKVSDELERVARDKATRATSSKFAGQDRLTDKIESTSANIAQQAKDAAGPNEYLSIIQKQGGRLQDKQADIAATALQDKQRRENAADEARLSLGAEKTRIREEDINEQKAQKTGLLTSGSENMMSGATGLAGVASTGVSDLTNTDFGKKKLSDMTDEELELERQRRLTLKK